MWLVQEKALSHSEELFDQADVSKDGKLQLSEVRDILRKSSEDYSHFAEHARFLDGCAPASLPAFFLFFVLLPLPSVQTTKWQTLCRM